MSLDKLLEKLSNEIGQKEEQKATFQKIIHDLKKQIKSSNPDLYVLELLFEDVPAIVLERLITKLNLRIYEDKQTTSEVLDEEKVTA